MTEAAERFDIHWIRRAPGPATQPPDPKYPFGMDHDITLGLRPACRIALPCPAAGIGIWAITCKRCGFVTACTTAGRADDPVSITIPCKRRENPHG
jgi:hypothetical protein